MMFSFCSHIVVGFKPAGKRNIYRKQMEKPESLASIFLQKKK